MHGQRFCENISIVVYKLEIQKHIVYKNNCNGNSYKGYYIIK